jgi:heat shock protein HslJ
MLTALAACATGASPGPSSGLPKGRRFLSTAVTENGAPKQLVAGTRIQLEFETDRNESERVVADAGCNTISGPASLQNGVLVIDGNELASTLMGCGSVLEEQDTWLQTFLASSPALHLDGDRLTLSGSAVAVTFVDRRVAEPDRPLTGTRWTVDTIYDANSASSVPTGTPAELVIDSTGPFHATTGCVGGELSGTASVQDSTITFAVTTQHPCAGRSNALDAAVRSVMSGPAGYHISDRSMLLGRADHATLGLHANDR